MAKKLTRRDFLRISALTAAGAALAACEPTPPEVVEKTVVREEVPVEQPVVVTSTPPESEALTVQYWVAWGQLDRIWEQLEETDEYAELVKGYEVELRGSVNTEAVLTAVAAGTPPAGLSNYQYIDFMARGALRPIDDLVAISSIVKEEEFYPPNWGYGFYRGTQYGVPVLEGFLTYGLNYNARLVEEAGLDPDNPPLTWEGCLDWHRALTKFDGAGNLLQIGLDPYDAMGSYFGADHGGAFFPLSWGFKWFDNDARTFNLNNENTVEALDLMGEFYRIAGPDNIGGMRQVEGQGTWGGSFNTEAQAMIIEGYWHPGETMTEKPEVGVHNRATWAPVPEGRKGAKLAGTSLHYVIFPKDGKNSEGMFKIAEFLCTDAAAEIVFNAHGWLPPRPSFLEKVDPSVYPGLDFYFDAVPQVTDWVVPARCEIMGFVDTQFGVLREAVYRGEMTAVEAAEEFQRRCEEEYQAAGFA